MRRVIFDLEVLRSFVTGIELGSFAKADAKLNTVTQRFFDIIADTLKQSCASAFYKD
jgi:hypothetical protein